ncbi:zinc finger, CCHC-type containing protein [Tanacetum coccineum]
MTQLLVKDALFNFSKECIQSFDTLKRELTQAPIMIKPDWSLPFEIMCDACDYAVGAVLGQRIDKHFKPIHYASKIMNEAQENYTTTEKELLAVVFAFDKFCQYLVLSKTIVLMIICPNDIIHETRSKTSLVRESLLLQEFDIKIRDKKCAKNLAADHLSRLEHPDLGKLTRAEIRDLFPEKRLMAISDKDNEPCVLTGIIRMRVPMMKHHKFFDNVTADHLEDITTSPPPRGKSSRPGFTSHKSFAMHVNMSKSAMHGIEFMVPFPSSNGNKCILVAIDYVSKWVEAQAFPTSDSRNVANFLRRLFARFRIPKALIGDRGTHFCNYQIEKAMKRYGVIFDEKKLGSTRKFQWMIHHCKAGNVGNKANRSGTKGSTDGSSNSLNGQNMFNKSLQVYYVTYVSEAYFVQDDDVAWLNIGSAFISTSKLKYSILWHARLGHVHFKRMQDMYKDGLILAFDMDTEKFCYVYLLHLKDEALDKFKVFKTKVELQQGSLIKRFRTDRGGEYMDTLYFQAESMVLGEVLRLPDPKLKALGERGIECIFVGYVEHSKAFRFYVIEPNDSVVINSIIKSRDDIFDENRFSSVPRPSQIGGLVVLEKVTKEDDPKTFDEVMKSQDVAFWKEEINDEMDSIMGNNTWVLADLPPGCKPLGCKWIFKRKLKVDGNVEKFKARMVIQGFKQKSWIDYFDIYAPVARISIIRLLIAMASIHSLIIHQMDVKTTFLNVLSNGYLLNQADKRVYRKFDDTGKGVIICLYVDDMLIFRTDQVQVDLTKEFLSSRFSMKDMGEADVILGIRIKHESNGIAISQSHYIEKVLKKFNYFDCPLVSTPMDTSEKLIPNYGQVISQLEYSRVIGCFMYAMTCTRPDIAFVVGKLSRNSTKLERIVGNFVQLRVQFILGNGVGDTTSIIDHHLGEMVFGRPFIEETGLVYNENEGAIMFNHDNEKITFKMPHTMKIFKQTRLMGLSTDSIPSSAYEENFGRGRTHYYQSLLIGDEYKQDEGDRRGIRHLMRLEIEIMDDKGEVT